MHQMGNILLRKPVVLEGEGVDLVIADAIAFLLTESREREGERGYTERIKMQSLRLN